MSSCAVVIVTYNGAPWIEGCLASLRAQQPVPHVIVVDNASTDGCADLVAAYGGVQLIRLAENVGFGRGNNVGIEAALRAGHPNVYLLNQDALAPPGSVAALVGFLAGHPEFGLVSPIHCSPAEPHVDPKTLAYYLAPHAREWLADLIEGAPQPHYRIHGLNAAAWMVRAETFRAVGGFDPLFFMYGEDDDYLLRLQHHGVGFALLPSARVVHLRQSPPRPPAGWWQRVRRLASREYSALLLHVKRAGFSLPYMALVVLVRGFFQPVGDFALDRDMDQFAARLMAAAQLSARLRKVHRHAVLCAARGPTHLQLGAGS